MLKVVVTDDEARVCQLILMLADWDSLGMEVAGVASNGLEALELVGRLHPDILITDIRMPGCHGLELIERAKGKFPQLEIVIVSGYAHFEFAQTAIKHGVGDYLLKPIKREELMGTLEKLGKRCRQRSQSASEVERLRQTNQENEDAVRKHLRSFLDQLLAQRSVFGAVEFSLALGPAASRIGELPASAQATRRIAANRLTEGAGRMFLLRPEIEGLERLGQEFEAACDRCGRKSELFQCLGRLQREQLDAVCQRRHNDTIRPIRMAKQYVQQHYSQPITLEDVCEVVGFSSLFKKETGEGFAKYLTRVRMERAKELLQQTSLPVSEICAQVGYSDLKHFSQNFKKETNLNPGQYRKLYG